MTHNVLSYLSLIPRPNPRSPAPTCVGPGYEATHVKVCYQCTIRGGLSKDLKNIDEPLMTNMDITIKTNVIISYPELHKAIQDTSRAE